ncbi:hypothetical protein UFOVP33_13 [uncultured Caudovirales phage]|uniref:Helix-turn-helix domain containing protein n=1 Tax=uncultured Caudovirales phage TaxID=2100421 RepID=A0A6J5KL69_9CAUD|nr:hypothetical protein UFOVP33_13 [uncultured Caudovirales phage]
MELGLHPILRKNNMQTEFMLLAIYNKPRLTFEQVCESIGVAKQTGYNLRARGEFPVHMTGTPLTADIRDVAAHLDKLRQTTPALS